MLEDLNLFVLIFISTLLVVFLWTKSKGYKIEKRVTVKVKTKRRKR